ncbi:hypothetical protein GCM10010527_53000 [Streptomyces drozdowiczii]
MDGADAGDDRVDPALRIGRIDRDIRRAGLEHGEDRDDQLGGTGQHERHGCLGPRARTRKPTCQPVRPSVEFAVTQCHVAEDHGGAVGGPRGVFLEHLVQTACPVRGDLGRRADRGGQFLRQPYVDPADRAFHVGEPLFQDGAEPADERLDGLPVEEITAELHDAADAGRTGAVGTPLPEVEGEIELGGIRPDGVETGAQTGQVERRLRLGAVRDHHLEQRVSSRRPLRIQLLHQQVEGDVLVAEGFKVPRAYPRQHVGEAVRACHRCAEHKGVDEEADHVLQRG